MISFGVISEWLLLADDWIIEYHFFHRYFIHNSTLFLEVYRQFCNSISSYVIFEWSAIGLGSTKCARIGGIAAFGECRWVNDMCDLPKEYSSSMGKTRWFFFMCFKGRLFTSEIFTLSERTLDGEVRVRWDLCAFNAFIHSVGTRKLPHLSTKYYVYVHFLFIVIIIKVQILPQSDNLLTEHFRSGNHTNDPLLIGMRGKKLKAFDNVFQLPAETEIDKWTESSIPNLMKIGW